MYSDSTSSLWRHGKTWHFWRANPKHLLKAKKIQYNKSVEFAPAMKTRLKTLDLNRGLSQQLKKKSLKKCLKSEAFTEPQVVVFVRTGYYSTTQDCAI